MNRNARIEPPSFKVTLTRFKGDMVDGKYPQNVLLVKGVPYERKDNSEEIRPPQGLNRLALAEQVLDSACVWGEMPEQVDVFYKNNNRKR